MISYAGILLLLSNFSLFSVFTLVILKFAQKEKKKENNHILLVLQFWGTVFGQLHPFHTVFEFKVRNVSLTDIQGTHTGRKILCLILNYKMYSNFGQSLCCHSVALSSHCHFFPSTRFQKAVSWLLISRGWSTMVMWPELSSIARVTSDNSPAICLWWCYWWSQWFFCVQNFVPPGRFYICNWIEHYCDPTEPHSDFTPPQVFRNYGTAQFCKTSVRCHSFLRPAVLWFLNTSAEELSRS